MAEIRIQNLKKHFGDFVAVNDSSFTIADGEFFVMLGPSGCGKTTTLRMIAGLEMPSEGQILLDGEDVTFNRASQRDIAFVFQLFALYPHMSVRRNISFPLRVQGVARREVRQRTEEVARLRMGIAGPDRPPAGDALVDYVLAPWTPDEQAAIETMLARAADACEAWLAEGAEAAMNRFNG